MSSSTVLKGTDAGLTVMTVLHAPGGSSNCHAVQITERATSGQAGALSLVSYNTESGALQIRSSGPYLQAFDASNTLKFQVGNDGGLTAGTLNVTGAVTLSSTLSVAGTVNLTGALAATDVLTARVTGDTQARAVLNAGGGFDFGPGNGAVDTNLYRGDVNLLQTDSALTVGGALNVSGYTTLAGGQANGNWAIFGNLSAFGSGKAYRFRTDGSSLDLEATGVDLILSNWSGTNFDGTQRSYLRFAANAMASQWAGKVEFVDALYGSTKHTLDGTTNTIGFFGTAPAAKQAPSGSRGGNAALASLLTALAAYGLITDNTSA